MPVIPKPTANCQCAGVAEEIDSSGLTKQDLEQGHVDFCASLLLDGKWLRQPVSLPGYAEPAMIIRQALDCPHDSVKRICYCDVLFPKGFRLKEAHTYTQPDVSYIIADARGDTWEEAFALALRRATKILAPIIERCRR
jgi:hypothetical protein